MYKTIGFKLIQLTLNLLNMLIGLSGILFVFLSIFSLQTRFELPESLKLNQIKYILLVTGIILLSLSIFACITLSYKSYIMLIIYACLITLMIVNQLVLIGIPAINRHHYIREQENFILEMYKTRHDKKLIYYLESSYKCCGPNGVQFYEISIPVSCCEKQWECNFLNAYKIGCVSAVQRTLKLLLDVNWIVNLAILIIEIIAMCFSICLAQHFKRGGLPKMGQ